MTRSVQQSLKRLQELWLQWLGASLQDNAAKEAETLRSLEATARQIGFSRLPDFALGAMARGVQAARDGDFARARRMLDAAERLDPGRPEVAFAEAEVSRRQGSWVRAAGAAARGIARLFSPTFREALVARVELWVLLALMLLAVLFVALEAALHGDSVLADFQGWLAGRVPAAVAVAVAVFLLLAPAALPGGLAWLLLIWSVLLWGYGSRSERWAFLLVWGVLALAPLGAAELERRLALAQSPPMRALSEFRTGGLTGTLFADLQVLRTALPEDPGVLELVADVHRTLGQWDLARGLYLQVVAREGDVPTALINLGAEAFRKGRFASANGYFQRAANAPTPSAAAWYNLSQSFSETYQFDDSRRALARARELDSARVDRWIQTPNPERVLTFNGGLARSGEIADRLVEVWTASGPQVSRFARWQPPVAVAIAVFLAVLLHLIRRSRGYAERPSRAAARGAGRWLRALVPAVGRAERGSGLGALGNLALIAALATLPLLGRLGGDIACSAAVDGLARALALAGFVVYVGLRVRHEMVAEI